MPNLHKKSWMVSNIKVYQIFLAGFKVLPKVVSLNSNSVVALELVSSFKDFKNLNFDIFDQRTIESKPIQVFEFSFNFFFQIEATRKSLQNPFIIHTIKVEIFLEQREVAFLSPSKISENLNFSTSKC